MLLVSQEKDGIINLDNILVIRLSTDLETNKKTIIYVDCIGDEHFGVGKYDTEARAKEVLQEIIERNSICNYFKCVNTEVQEAMACGFARNNYIFDTYEMPEK